ncbi:MAG: ion transporter [bacterium]|nr:ion transporter [bacterium]
MKHPKRNSLSRTLEPLLHNPLYNFAAILVTIASILILIVPLIVDLSLSERAALRVIDRAILLLFLAEMLLRLIGMRRRRYFPGLTFWIDLIVVLPLFHELGVHLLVDAGFISPADRSAYLDFPGLYLIQGVRTLRLLHSIQYFYLQKQMGLTADRVMSSTKQRIFSGVSSILFFIILALGVGVSIVVFNLTEIQKQNRLQQVRVQATSYGVLQAKLLFEEFVMAVTVTVDGEKETIESERFPAERVREYFRYRNDYIQLDGVNPGESVQVSFRDLNRRREIVEFATLATGMLVVFALLISLNYYLTHLVLTPVERAMRVIELRLSGEELESSDIRQTPFTEITLLVNGMDLLYQKMRAPARKQITDREHPRRRKSDRPPESDPDS